MAFLVLVYSNARSATSLIIFQSDKEKAILFDLIDYMQVKRSKCMLIMMEGSESFTDTVLSWSLEDICNENLYKHQEDTRAQLQCRIGTMYKAPFGKVISIQESNPHGTKQYNVKVDSWRNSVSKECKTRPGDLFILADAKAESVSDLQKEGRSLVFLIAIEVFPKSRSEDDGTSLHFKARTSKKFDVNSGIPTSLFIIFLENIGPNIRIDKAMHMCTSARWRLFYSLSSGVVNHLLSDREGRELVLPFEVTDEEMEAILYNRSTFIAGRSGTGKTTVLTMKLFQKEQYYNMAEEGLSAVEQSSGGFNATVLRQIFVTVSPKLCIAVKQHVSNLKSFASGVSCHSAEFGSIGDQDDCDDTKAEFRDLPNSFLDIPSKCYPLFITFHKFLMMLDGSLSNSYFERLLDNLKLSRSPLQSSRSTLLKSFMRTKEVNYERFCSSYWPHFNMKLTKRLDALRVFTEIISHIKGGLRALEAGDGKLSQSDYVKMSECRASNLCQKEREIIYDIFQAYEKMKTRNGEYDIADFVIDIHRRLQREKYKGDEINFVYIDEVQDLTISQIMLFKHICSNVEEGFVFSGDTAQTISKGIDFRFQDIRHLFYKKFVLDSRSNEHNQRNDKAEISKIFHLSQNFRTHGGVLRLSQSIIDLLCHFFPEAIDSLNPETSPIHGESPVLLQSRENEDMIVKLFGSSATNFVGFGAEQVILVRDASVQKEISNPVGKQALVLTIVECKGLEFQDVLLYKYFGSSPIINEWRLIYNYMKEHDLLDPTLPKPFPTFDRAKHNFLCSELKQLYVAISRTRKRLWIYEDMEGLCNPMFDYWIKKSLVQVRQLDDSFVENMKVSSSSEEWKSRGMKLYHERNYEMATMCFQNAHDTYWERRSKAGGLKVMAYCMQTSNPEEAKSILREAAEIFEDVEMASSAAQCFFDSGDYERASMIYKHKCGKQAREKAAECFFLAECYESAAEIFQSIGKAESAARCYYKLRENERAGTINLKSSGDEPGLKRARKAREAVAKSGHDNEAGNGDSKAMNQKLGGGKLPTGTPSLAGTMTLESSGVELGLKRARKAGEVFAKSGHDIEAGKGDSKAMNQKSGRGKLPTGTFSLAWSGVVVVSLLAGAFVVHSVYKLDLWSKNRPRRR
ncbi:uncharacterized protein LOC133709044 [Rosa rugosa]|uniref:uncharacterized protein LOC133709044 n=1 Tax=Rosa rugosa TaxID=74645 RepID=UPI002B4042A9|nr:uncharacterized protein LOC133709044 [Rosa rugosa]